MQVHGVEFVPCESDEGGQFTPLSPAGAEYPEPLLCISPWVSPAAKLKIQPICSVRVLKISTQHKYCSSHQGSEGGQSSTLVLGNCGCIPWIYEESEIFLTF